MTQYKTREEIIEFLARADKEMQQADEDGKLMDEEEERDAKKFSHAISEVNRLIAIGEAARERQRQEKLSQEQEEKR